MALNIMWRHFLKCRNSSVNPVRIVGTKRSQDKQFSVERPVEMPIGTENVSEVAVLIAVVYHPTNTSFYGQGYMNHLTEVCSIK